MSKKPVNFYQGAKGTFRIDIVKRMIHPSLPMMTRATHTYDEIKQAIEDGFIPYCIFKDGPSDSYYYLSAKEGSTNLHFIGEYDDVIIDSDGVEIREKESGDSGGSVPQLLHDLKTISYTKTTQTTIPANASTSVTLTRQSGNIPSEYDFKAITGVSVGDSLVSINGINTSNAQQISMQIINNTSSEIVIPANTITIEIKYIKFLLQ